MSQLSEYSECGGDRERIFPSFGATASLLALLTASSFAIWAALDFVIAATFFLLGSIFISLWWRSAIHRVSVRDGWLHVNEAAIELRYISAAAPLEVDQWQRRRGVDFEPALFHGHKFWMKRGVEISLNDSRDPHPGWLIGSRRPQALAEAINQQINQPTNKDNNES